MNKIRNSLLAIAVIILIVVGAIFIANMYKQPPGNDNSNSSDESKPSPSAAIIITYDGNDFTLSATTMKAGETIKIINNSSKELDFDSNPHPIHTDNPELNAGAIAPGKDKSIVIETKGVWGFHNHLNASQRGSLTVE